MNEDRPIPSDPVETRLREEAERFSLQPSPRVWQQVREGIQTGIRRKRSGWLGAPVLLLLVFFAGYLAWYTRGDQVPSVKSASGSFTSHGIHPMSPSMAGHSVRPGSGNSGSLSRATSRLGGSFVRPEILALKARRSGPRRPGSGNTGISSMRHTLPAIGLPLRISLEDGTKIPLFASGIPADISIRDLTDLVPVSLSGDSRPGPGGPVRLSLVRKPIWKRVAVDFFVASGLAFRNLIQNYTPHAYFSTYYATSTSTVGIPSSQLQHSPDLGFTVGVHVRLPLNARWQFASGLQFTQTGYSIRAIKTQDGSYSLALPGGSSPAMDPSSGNPNLSSARFGAFSNYYASLDGTTKLHNRYQMLELPLMADYRIPITRKLSFHLSAGFGLDYLLDRQSYMLAPSYKRYILDNSQVRNWNANFLFSAYMSLPVGRYFLQLGPEFQYQLLNTYIQPQPIREYPYTTGLRIGISRKP